MRRISTKLVLAVLAAVALPFLGFALYMDQAVAEGFTRRVVDQALQGLAADLGARLDRLVAGCDEDVRLWAEQPIARFATDESNRISEGDPNADPSAFHSLLVEGFNERVRLRRIYDLVLLVDARGRLVAANSTDREGLRLEPDLARRLELHDYSTEPWFAPTIAGAVQRIDQHVSPLWSGVGPGAALADTARHVGFAAPVESNRTEGDPSIGGVLFTLVSWDPFQELTSVAVLKETFRGLVRPGEEPSPYAWIWGADGDTILAHLDRSLYGKSVSRDVGLPAMVAAVNAPGADWGMYPSYEFRGAWKTAAFKRCLRPGDGGFGWVVGVGIDDADVFARSQELRKVLLGGTAVVLLVILLWTMVIARRTTSPILALQEHTRRVAAGDLDARLEPTTRDELGELTESFNRMTADLREQRARIVKAEKDAAWREMARQIAHDIKGPLTPIQLSVDLLRRARDEGSPEFPTILERTLGLMGRQVDSLREIAQDFYEFTGGRRPEPTRFAASELVDEVLDLVAAWGTSTGVSLARTGADGTLHVDRGKLRRVLENLVSNAFHAMPDGGALEVRLVRDEARGTLAIEVLDTGEGLSEEAAAHLFEPYFTTRGEGTGLGLAIAQRVVEEMDGAISLARRPEGRGTVACVTLGLDEAGGG